ncbi:MAG TPA: CDGSH iron-sulfur domain-containing protein [Williamwhitmania sp.]|nr:CDGSH iron-sulfur domain-containing protein [Williamwhitmania sp.]
MEESKDKEKGISAEIKVPGHGPIKVYGNFEIFKEGKKLEFDGDSVEFCGCGRSENLPFCDGTHKKVTRG